MQGACQPLQALLGVGLGRMLPRVVCNKGGGLSGLLHEETPHPNPAPSPLRGRPSRGEGEQEKERLSPSPLEGRR